MPTPTVSSLARAVALSVVTLSFPVCGVVTAQKFLYSVSSPGTSGPAVIAAGVDIDLDSVPDFVVGNPDDDTVGTNVGIVRLYSAATGLPILQLNGPGPNARFGSSLGIGPDCNGDGRPDMVVAHALATPYQWSLAIYSSSSGSLISTLATVSSSSPPVISTSGDATGDGIRDILVGDAPFRVFSGSTLAPVPHLNNPTLNCGGRFPLNFIGDITGDGKSDIASGSGGDDVYSLVSGATGAELSCINHRDVFSIAGLGDINGDGLGDFASINAPDYFTCACTGYIAVLAGPNGGGIRSHFIGTSQNSWQGALVVGLGDVNGDGWGDYLGRISGVSGGGIYSGFSGSLISNVLGTLVSAAAVGDTNSDALSETLVVYGSGASMITFGNGPWTFCQPKVNSLGCTPLLAANGVVDMSANSSMTLVASNVRTNHTGLMFGGPAASVIPFLGGWKCSSSYFRTLPLQSGGAPGENSCAGQYTFDITPSFLTSKGLGVGSLVTVQFWSRDSGFPHPNNIGLTSSLGFVIAP
jgi:hypothetical protein